MKDFNRGGGFNDRKGGGNFGRRDSGGRSGGRGFNRGGDDSSRPTMHKATCAECGNPCEVPFKPSGDRPVLCSNCFKGKDGMSAGRSGSRDFSRPSFGDKQMFKATCAECGNSCEVPFKPSSGKPVFCSDCFGKTEKGRGANDNARPSHGSSHGAGVTAEQFEMLNAKLDKILRALNPAIQVENVLSKDSIKKEVAKVEKAVKAETKNILHKITKKIVAKKPATIKKNKKK